MKYRTLGRTGEKVSAVGVGGWHLSLQTIDEAMAVRIVREAIDNGINFMDNSWDYRDGESERRMGNALKDGYREKAFVMTKIDARTRQLAAKQLDESLRRLEVDHIDLVQHHEILRFEDPDRIFGLEGANEALVEAREAGKIRYIGFTGHKDPRVHMYMLEVATKNGFAFDTVQMPLNVMDAHFRSFADMVAPAAVEQNIGVLGMKPMGNGVILKSGTVTAMECLHYALNLPVSVVITGMENLDYLYQAIEAVDTFEPLSNQELNAILEKTREAALSGRYEPFKTTSIHDGTAKNPEWLGEEPEEVKGLMG